MSKEMDLLKKILATGWLNNTISCEVEELLAQPEQEPVAWKVIDGTHGGYMFSRIKPTEHTYKYNVVIPLYTAPQKREPFGPEERQRLSKAYSTRAEQVAFEEGIIFAKILYGIGGGE